MIKNTPILERPRERCLGQGPECLSLRECIALILGSGPKHKGCMGVSNDILNRPGQGLPPQEQERAFFMALESSANAHLQNISGLGPAGKARLLAAFDLARRYANYREKNAKDMQASLPRHAQLSRRALKQIKSNFRSERKEWLGFVPYNHPKGIGEFCMVERGVRTHVNSDPAELFARILALRPSGFFLFHNHPSGDLTPSEMDIILTERVKNLSSEFGITLLGHGIVSAQGEVWI